MKRENDLSVFVGNSSLSKTLKNRLIPIGKTQENIECSGILSEDELRAEKRKPLKNIMDDYYRWFIERVLKDLKLEWKELFETLESVQKGLVSEKELKEIEKQKRTEMFEKFSSDDNFKKIFCAKLITDILPEFIMLNKEYTDSQKEENIKIVKLFNQFTTSFTDFFNNRKNIFSKEEIASSSCYRVVNVNTRIFFENMKAYRRIEKDMESEIQRIEEQNVELLDGWKLSHIYSTDYYNFLMIQPGIDYYNEICGKINLYMNLYCQKNKLNKNLYKMRKLQKQILSITQSNFDIPEQFENDEEIYSSINCFINKIKQAKIKERLMELGKNTEQYDFEKIYISSKYFSDISMFLCGDWAEIQDCLTGYFQEQIHGGSNKDEKIKKAVKSVNYLSLSQVTKIIAEFSVKDNIESVENYISHIYEIVEQIELKELIYDPKINFIENDSKIQEMKKILDNVLNIVHWKKIFDIDEEKEKDINFYTELNNIYDEISEIIPLYNKVRNFVTKKPYSVEKIKLNFGIPTLADGWSKSKEYNNNAVLFIKDEKYYLGIFNAKNKPEKEIIEGNIERKSENDFKKIVYKLLPGPNKMLPKVFLSSKKGVETYHPSEYIIEGYKENKHIKSSKTYDYQYCHDLIDYFKTCISHHPEWKDFNFSFSNTEDYTDISEFYKEVADQGYKIEYVYINESVINKLVEEGKMYLFQIYNKDFSEGKKGTDNLHTMYLKNLFSEENLKDVVLKLNGSAEVFFRKSSIKQPKVHKTGTILVNRTYKEIDEKGNEITKFIPEDIYREIYQYYNGKQEKISPEAKKIMDKCSHYPATMDIVKDKRFTVDQYFFHCPITINFKAKGKENVNDLSLKYIAQTNDINIIGIDRGERNLIYVSLINTKGNIIKQKSYNIVNNYNYKDKLDEKEHVRQKARKNWKEIGKIKEIKEGYLSQVIHEITQMVIDYNAIVVMEDLNYGFKRGRFKVEKQVYQKFETMLINKMNYLVDKNKAVDENGGVLRGYQLSYIPDNLSKLGKQCGMIFYVPAGYTSKIDPTTGFVDVFRHKELTSGSKKKEFLLKFNEIKYDKSRDMFVFSFDYNNFGVYQTNMSRTKWDVYTNGERVISYRKDGYWIDEIIKPTEKIKIALNKKEIDYSDGHNLIEDIKNLDDKSRNDLEIITIIQAAFKNTVTMRNSLTNDESYDKIVSPVLNDDRTFFDSSKVSDAYPVDADANGAFHIALKGLYLVEQIKENWKEGQRLPKDVLKISNEKWFDYVQNQRYKE